MKEQKMDEAWQQYCDTVMPYKKKPGFVYPLEGTMYAVWCAAWKAALKEKKKK